MAVLVMFVFSIIIDGCDRRRYRFAVARWGILL